MLKYFALLHLPWTIRIHGELHHSDHNDEPFHILQTAVHSTKQAINGADDN